jgi:glycosyltransferase involved in cell wall biosynthesis
LEKHLHIICFTIPYPVDYGGVYDLFYKLPALQAQGVKIHLHCFEHNRTPEHELNKYCEEVCYYPRFAGHKGVSLQLPYIVASRINETLAKRLLKDDYPILMEGVHSSFITMDNRFNGRKKFIRIHNIEHEYYSSLSQSTWQPLKKLYYWRESNLLKKYEHTIVTKANAFWGVTTKDVAYFRKELGCNTIDYLPVYLPTDWQINGAIGFGNYCLYQADLSVEANEKAALWLLEKVFSQIKIPLVIAGKNPSAYLQKIAHKQLHTCIVANPEQKQMQDMIAKAHVHILPSFHNSGIKLKLLNALYNGRHCLVNDATVVGTNLDNLCTVANTADEFIEALQSLEKTEFSQEHIAAREAVLYQHFNNQQNAKQQVQWIWG